MTSLLETALKLPVLAMRAGVSVLAENWQAIQQAAVLGVDGMVSQAAHSLRRSPGLPTPNAALGQEAPELHEQERECRQADPLYNGYLKLVEYKVLFVKRGLETAFPHRQELVWDCLTNEQFRIWKIAEFVQHLCNADLPDKWRRKNYPPRPPGGAAVRLPAQDGKYLRVWFQVVSCYPREPFCFEERQLEALWQIRNAIRATGGKVPPEPPPPPALAAAPEKGEAAQAADRQETPLQLPAASTKRKAKNKKGGEKAKKKPARTGKGKSPGAPSRTAKLKK